MKKRRLSRCLFLASALLLALPGQIMGMNIVKETEDDSKPVITEMSALEIASYVNAQDEENEDLLDAVAANQGDDGAAVSDFETMRLILLTQDLQKSYGASRIVKYDDMDMYLLQYETKSAAAEAYSLITEDLGSASCYADTIISEEAAAPLPSDYYWDYPTYDDEDRLISSWGTAFMGMDVLRDQVITDHPVTVAVLDSGLDVSNPFFDHYTISNRCYDFDQGKRGKKYMTDGDKDGHGTHVAGTILDALPSNTIMLPLRIVYGQTPVSEFASAISYAVDEGAQIINCSFYVGTFDDYGKGPLDSVLQKAKSNDVIVVASAGNDSQNSLIYPGSSTLTVCVSSIDCFDGYISYFSNYDSRVDFTAPGEGITAAKDGSRDGSLKSMDGTSMSTPEVSAAFAYLKMAYPNDTWKKSYNRLKSMCRDLGDEGKDIYYGWGMPVMTSLLDQMHVHDFQASTTSKGQHILHCSTCDYEMKKLCSTYTIADDGSYSCSYCGRAMNTTFLNGVLTIASEDKAFLSIRSAVKAAKAKVENGGWDPIREVLIGEGYTVIPATAFSEQESLTKVTCPSTLKMIETKAFYFCNALTTINLHQTAVTEIGTAAFASCASLKTVKLPASLKKINADAFSCSNALTSIDLENTQLTQLENNAFSDCFSLKQVILPKTLKSMGMAAFAFCSSLKKVTYLGKMPSLIMNPNFDWVNIYLDDTLTVYYPKNNSSWNKAAKSPKNYQYEGKVTYKSFDPDTYIPSMTFSGVDKTYSYTGKAIKPTLTIKNSSGKKLKKNTDYTVKYSNYTKLGQAAITVKGKGKYSGSRIIYYRIVRAALTDIFMSEDTFVFNNEEQAPLATVMAGSNAVLINTQAGDENVELTMDTSSRLPGTYQIKAVGYGNYKGSVSVNYRIVIQPYQIEALKKASKAFTVSWQPEEGALVDGYQVQYAKTLDELNQDQGVILTLDSPEIASLKVSDLSGSSKYYVKIRSYLNWEDTTYYSDWSIEKSVKTKA